MPSTSKAQQGLMGLALHHPEKLHKKNRGILSSMSKDSMRDYAETSTKDLPKHSTLYMRKKRRP